MILTILYAVLATYAVITLIVVFLATYVMVAEDDHNDLRVDFSKFTRKQRITMGAVFVWHNLIWPYHMVCALRDITRKD